MIRTLSMLQSISLTCVAFVAAMALAPPSAEASVMFEIQRLNDTEAIISGSGTYDFETLGQYSSLLGATTTGDGGVDPIFDSTMQAGALAQLAAFTSAGTVNYFIRFGALNSGALISAGSLLSGSFRTILDAETWGAIGTTGDVIASSTGALLGSYSITEAVPEPATLALMGLGLAGIGYRRQRSKKAV